MAQSLNGPSFNNASYGNDHVHNLGVNPVTQTLFYISSKAGIREINTNGYPGSEVLSASVVGSNPEDAAYYGGDYLVARFDRRLYLQNGSTGASTVFLTTAQLTAMGVTGSVSGVDLNFQAVPEPGTWSLLLLGMGTIALFARQRYRS